MNDPFDFDRLIDRVSKKINDSLSSLFSSYKLGEVLEVIHGSRKIHVRVIYGKKCRKSVLSPCDDQDMDYALLVLFNMRSDQVLAALYREIERELSPKLQHIRSRRGGAEVDLNGETVQIQVIRSKRAKSYRASFKDGEVRLTVPTGGTKERGLLWLDENLRALEKWHTEYLRQLQKQKEASSQLSVNRKVTIYGEEHRLVFVNNRRDEGVGAGEIRVCPPKDTNDDKLWETAITRVLKEEIRQYALEQILLKTSSIDDLGIPFSKLIISSAQTRWGSCSVRGIVRLNWRAVFLPKDVIDYLICHELAHLKHMNHSKNFWARVEMYCPNYREFERKLKGYSISHSVL